MAIMRLEITSEKDENLEASAEHNLGIRLRNMIFQRFVELMTLVVCQIFLFPSSRVIGTNIMDHTVHDADLGLQLR